MEKTILTLLGIRYSSETSDYPILTTTQKRLRVKAVLPGGSIGATTLRSNGKAFRNHWTGDGRQIYMPGFLEIREDDRIHFVPLKQEHVFILHQWDRTMSPSKHVPDEVMIEIARALKSAA